MKKLKILQLNVWGGRIKDGLTRCILEGDYDVVCMQEAAWDANGAGFLDLFIDTVDKIKRQADFPFDFRSEHFGINMLGEDVKLKHGIAILSKIPFIETEEKIILGDEAKVATNISNYKDSIDNHRYTAQKVVLENGLVLVNYHGYYITDPLGNEMSRECMRSVAEMIKNESAPVVLCGDLNVISEAPAMRELDFLTDLTVENNIKTTLRNIRFVKDVPCDHILINDKVSFEKFEVLDLCASDHKALAVEIMI